MPEELDPCEMELADARARIADFESGRVYQELQARITELTKTLREWQEGYPGGLVARIAELEEHYNRRGRVVDELEEQVERLREDVKSCHVVIKERDYFKKQNDMLWDRLREEA